MGTFWKAHYSWSIVNGTAYNYIDGTGGTLRTSAKYTQPSYIIETAAKGFTDNRDFRITFGQADLAKDSMYVLTISSYFGRRLTLSRSSDNVYFGQTLDEIALYPDLNSVSYYKFKIARYSSGLIQVYLDKGTGYSDTPLLEAIDLAYSKLGHTGWQVDTEAYAESFYVDWFTAYKPSKEKPADREKPKEDDLITQVSAESKSDYKVTKLAAGITAFTDRKYTVTSFPSYLKGASFIQTAVDDKANKTESFLTFFLKKDAIVYIAYDHRETALPAWLIGWTKTGDRISTTDSASGYMDVYSKLFQSGEIYPHPLILGGNLANPAAGAKISYLVAAVQRPNPGNLQAENAYISGAVVSADHPGYNGTGFVDYIHPSNDYIEWTVEIDLPGTYNLGFTYANGSLAERILDITDNGNDIGPLSFYTSGSWSSWPFVSDPNVFLSKGMHKIRATATGSGGPNIDQLSLVYTSADISLAPVNNLISDNISKLPEVLNKVYPNPFKSNTTLYYFVPKKDHVSLTVYSLKGERLQVLVNEFKDAGNYQATFNAANSSAGIYIYQLKIGNDIKTGKLLKE